MKIKLASFDDVLAAKNLLLYGGIESDKGIKFDAYELTLDEVLLEKLDKKKIKYTIIK